MTRSSGAAIGLAFTEAKDWIGEWSDSSNGAFKGPDGALYHKIKNPGRKAKYVMPDRDLRGGFRYMTVFLVTNNDSSTRVHIDDITLEIAFQPTWPNLRAYQGYFHSDDELLNRIWYSGAYTLQTNAVPVNTGRRVPFETTGWANDGILGPGETIIVDGAKRDRAVWPGDMGVAVPSASVSTGDLESVKNALQVMYDYQDETTGAFDESGPPLSQKGSDTYHMWTMIGTYNYVLFTNNTEFLLRNWNGYRKAMDFIYGKVDSDSGLLNVTGIRDWARWQQGFNNSEAQMILYHTLKTGADLATWAGDTTGLTTTWTSRAEDLKKAINAECFDPAYGAFKDNATSTSLHPQDANSLALLFGVVDATEHGDRASSISDRLTKNWTPIGAVAPELPENICPFISSFEIQAHFVAGETDRALDLVRRSWGWYLDNPNGTQSTAVEGYLANGTFGYRSSRGYGYDASYTSHAHGWSSGPTSALTNYVLGLSVTAPLGERWRLAPQLGRGDLRSVEGGFVTALGKFKASWKRSLSLLGASYVLQFEVPEGTEGEVVLPSPVGKRQPSVIIMDGKRVQKGVASKDKTTATITVTGGGSHRIFVS
ncbi:hypothetical protein VTN00DRAFT_2310 [Thermoascus crustaceus]|uniref:uncharacterized protein n=1 Tax=Thermoascus crustaceus TaxID=5088 RepID=UPI00374389DC